MLIDFDEMYRDYYMPWDTGMPSSELGRRLAAGEIRPEGKALDLGCGTGSNVLYLAQWGFDAVGVDMSPRAIQLAQEKANLQKMGRAVRFVLGDVTRIRNIGEPFDFLFDRGCYHHLRQFALDTYLQSLDVFARTGALYLSLSGNAKEQTKEGPPRVAEEQIRAELGTLFDIIDLREFQFDPSPQEPNFRPLAWSCLMRKR